MAGNGIKPSWVLLFCVVAFYIGFRTGVSEAASAICAQFGAHC